MTLEDKPSNMNSRRLGFVLSYRSPRYIRSTTIRAALESIPSITVDDAVNESPRIKRYFQTIQKIRRILKNQKTRLWFINFRGHEIYWPVRWLVGRKSKIIFDELISPYDVWINERKTFSEKSLIARLVFRIEKAVLKDTDYIVTDSPHQAEHYMQLYGVPKEKFTVVRGSVDENLFSPSATPRKLDFPEPFVVFTYSTFIPLHGMEFILPAAELVKDLPIRFLVVGGKGKKLANFLQEKEDRELNNITHMEWINFTELPSYIRGANICLGGPFGDSNQARRVITGKALQFLACECPTMIGITAETQEYFTDKRNCLMVELGNPQAIADAIRWAYHHPQQLPEIGRQGRIIYEKHYSMEVLSRTLNTFINSIPIDLT